MTIIPIKWDEKGKIYEQQWASLQCMYLLRLFPLKKNAWNFAIYWKHNIQSIVDAHIIIQTFWKVVVSALTSNYVCS